MKIIYGINKIRKFRSPVVALGVFDGVHLGHQRILKAAVDKAKRINGASMVVTFWPDPHKEKSLYSLEHRLRLIESIGIDICIVIRFSLKFSAISAQDFVKEILVKKIGTHYVYVGKNFRFGKKGEGDTKTLYDLSFVYGFELKIFDIVRIAGKPISSTYIRNLITAGKINIAHRLLAKPVSILGTVIKGTSLATSLGFPTANINPHHEILPPSGIYAVLIIHNNKKLKGVCYIGSRPTFMRGGQRYIEVHIFNFKENIYGKDLEIQFIKKIRDDQKFSSLDSLAAQIKKDVFSAHRILSPIFHTTISGN